MSAEISETLINIRNREASSIIVERIDHKILVKKFFLLGSFVTLILVAALGTHLWLQRSGIVPVGWAFYLLRNLHAHAAFFGALGLFVSGFLLQAAPSLFGAKEIQPKAMSIQIVLWSPLVGLGLLLFQDLAELSKYVFALSFLVLGLEVARYWRSFRNDLGLTLLLLLGLAGGLLSSLRFSSDAYRASLYFWIFLAPILIAIQQLFVSNLMSGRKLGGSWGKAVMAFVVLSFLGAFVEAFDGSGLSSPVFRWSTLAACVLLWPGLHLHKILNSQAELYLRLAFVFAMIWAVAGALFSVLGPAWADVALHSWALGWAFSLIIALSQHIFGFLNSRPVMPAGRQVALICLWQVVVSLRVLTQTIILPRMIILAGIFVLLVAIGMWFVALAKAYPGPARLGAATRKASAL